MSIKGQCAGVATFALLSLGLGLAGCVQTQDNYQPFSQSTMSGCPRCQGNGAAPDGEVMQTSFRPQGGGLGLGQPRPVDSPPLGGNCCPRELMPVSHPPYTVSPPDVLLIDVFRAIPKGPYRLEALETLEVAVSNTLPNQPITGRFVISPEGTISLGYGYGTVNINKLTLDEAEKAIRKHLEGSIKGHTVSLGILQIRGIQQVSGQHLVRPDGTISLGTYGSLYVAGMMLGQIKCALEQYLSAYLIDPQVSVDVFAYNSKVYYVILDGGGYGQQVFPLPITGNETVLDAISRVGGLAPVSSTRRIFLARPSPVDAGCNQILPVDWHAVLMGSTATNYQIFPGDRIYVDSNCLIRLDNRLAQVFQPIERVLGLLLLGGTTWETFRSNGVGGSNSGFLFTPR